MLVRPIGPTVGPLRLLKPVYGLAILVLDVVDLAPFMQSRRFRWELRQRFRYVQVGLPGQLLTFVGTLRCLRRLQHLNLRYCQKQLVTHQPRGEGLEALSLEGQIQAPLAQLDGLAKVPSAPV